MFGMKRSAKACSMKNSSAKDVEAAKESAKTSSGKSSAKSSKGGCCGKKSSSAKSCK